MEAATHRCPGPGCPKQVPDNLLMCSAHWYAVPIALRKVVWREYRREPGSQAHLAACRAAAAALMPSGAVSTA